MRRYIYIYIFQSTETNEGKGGSYIDFDSSGPIIRK